MVKPLKVAKAAVPKYGRPKHKQEDHMPQVQAQPKLLRKEPKLTAKELYNSIWEGDKERSNDISVKTVKEVKPPKSLPEYIVFRCVTYNHKNKHTHYVTIMFKDRVSANSKCIVDSDTPRHVFFYEYALAKRGNAFIYRSNGEPPVRTNPRNKVGIDKHIRVVLRHLLKNNRG